MARDETSCTPQCTHGGPPSAHIEMPTHDAISRAAKQSNEVLALKPPNLRPKPSTPTRKRHLSYKSVKTPGISVLGDSIF